MLQNTLQKVLSYGRTKEKGSHFFHAGKVCYIRTFLNSHLNITGFYNDSTSVCSNILFK